MAITPATVDTLAAVDRILIDNGDDRDDTSRLNTAGVRQLLPVLPVPVLEQPAYCLIHAKAPRGLRTNKDEINKV